MTRVGAIFQPYVHEPGELLAAARTAEDAGVAELWLWEDCFRASGVAAAAAALAVTERLRVGIGILPMPLRNVALTAMEIGTIERMLPGRLLPGLGHGVQEWMGQAGARVASPLTLLREYVPALRALLAGDELSVDGRYISLDRVRLEVTPASAVRVYAAAEGPKTLAAVGEVADGVVLDSRHSVTELRTMVSAVQGARNGQAPADVVAYTVCAFGDGAEAAVRADLGARGVDDDRALWGSVDDVAAGVRRIAAAGVDDVVLLPVGDGDLEGFLRAAGEVGARVADA